MNTNPLDLLKGKVVIPSLPIIFTRINEAVNNPRMSIADIGKIISEDSGLSSRLLKIANSALYGFPAKIETISRAVTIIGTQQLRDLSLATVVLKLFKGIPREVLNMEAFWRHSIACGIAARILATYRREPNVERYFVAGMLHDVGRLVLCMKMPAEMRLAVERTRANGELLHVIEAEVLGVDHAAVGGMLMRLWNLPPTLEVVVMHHHQPLQAESHPVETAMIHISDVIAHAMQLGRGNEMRVPLFEPASWERVGLPLSVLSPVMNQVDRQFQDALQTICPDAEL
jgi:HD-like signal output (HDOD) protein